MPPLTPMEQVREELGEVRGEVNMHTDQISEIYAIQRHGADLTTQTAANLQHLTTRFEAMHTPDTCVYRSKVERMWTVFLVIGGLLAAMGAFGLLGKFGDLIWNAIVK